MSDIAKRDDVFCRGSLLHTVQMSRIFKDSKTFVDMKMRHSPQEILDKYQQLMQTTKDNPSKRQVEIFVDENFEKTDVEYTEWLPKDWKENPKFLTNIVNNEYRQFGYALHKLWKNLGRKISKEAEQEIQRSSLIWVPNPIIVPGGRFREFYYWDTYWIIRGLLISEMYQTTKGMLDNFLLMVDQYGYIPNGGRIYYLGRSQPPTLIPSFKAYMDVTQDMDYLTKSIKLLEKEFEFWITKRTKIVKLNNREYKLATYGNSSEGPRPESYAEDVTLTEPKGSNDRCIYSEIKAACESGMDFTSRWFISDTNSSLLDIKTTSVFPVDLNAFLYSNAVILREFNEKLRNFERAKYYKTLAEKWLEAVTEVLWHEDIGVWLDYDLEKETKRDRFYASNLTPIWAKCYDETSESKVVDLALDYIEKNGILNFPGED